MAALSAIPAQRRQRGPTPPSRLRRGRPPSTALKRACRNEPVIRLGVQTAGLAPRRLLARARRIARLCVPALVVAGAGPDERPRQGAAQGRTAGSGQEEGSVPPD